MNPTGHPPMPPPAQAPAQAPPRDSRFRRGLLAGVVVGACLVGAAWGITALLSSVTGPGAFTLQGSMELNDYGGVRTTGSSCAGKGGYSDIRTGASVTVYDSANAVVASGRLVSSTPISRGCRFDIEVPDVPAGEEFYQVEVSHRGKVTVSAQDAEEGTVALVLGD